MQTLAIVQGSKDYQIWFERGHLNCSCPHYQYRLRKTASACKHIQEAKPQIAALLGIETKAQMELYAGPAIFIQREK